MTLTRVIEALSTQRGQSAGFWLCVIGLVLAISGFFGPWVPHKAAALTVTGFELAEFAKFFPEVQARLVPITRELFLTPLIAGAVLFGLLIHKRACRPSVRLIATGLAALLTLAALPPYQFMRAPEYRTQLLLAAAGLLLALLTPLAHWLTRRAQGILVTLFALAGALVAPWQFAHLQPLIVALYNKPFGLGWGIVASVSGFGLLLISGVLTATGSDRATPDTRPTRPVAELTEINYRTAEMDDSRADGNKESIVVYGTAWCGDSMRARRFFDQHKIPYRWVDIDRDPQARAYVEAVNYGYRSVPTIVFPDGSILVEPSSTELARKLG